MLYVDLNHPSVKADLSDDWVGVDAWPLWEGAGVAPFRLGLYSFDVVWVDFAEEVTQAAVESALVSSRSSIFSAQVSPHAALTGSPGYTVWEAPAEKNRNYAAFYESTGMDPGQFGMTNRAQRQAIRRFQQAVEQHLCWVLRSPHASVVQSPQPPVDIHYGSFYSWPHVTNLMQTASRLSLAVQQHALSHSAAPNLDEREHFARVTDAYATLLKLPRGVV